jgi:transposase
MEDVLDLYAEPYDPARPVVCFDELAFQLQDHRRPPQAAAPGRPTRIDYQYERRGTCNLLGFFQPLAGWRHFAVTAQHTAVDFAHQLRTLVDEHFPDAAVIRLVVDNLNTHSPAALYKTFTSEEARRITQKIEWHYTPTHGSWLNMIEIEFAIVTRQCLQQRVPSIAAVAQVVKPWVAQRNAAKATVEWRFTTQDARRKLTHLYPRVL